MDTLALDVMRAALWAMAWPRVVDKALWRVAAGWWRVGRGL